MHSHFIFAAVKLGSAAVVCMFVLEDQLWLKASIGVVGYRGT